MTNRDEQDPGKLADKLDREADRMQRRSDELGDEVEQVRQDWQRKRADEGVPGAMPADDARDEDTGDEDTGDEDTGDEDTGDKDTGDGHAAGGADAAPRDETSAQGERNDASPGREAGDAQSEEPG